MKFINTIARAIAATLLCFAACTPASFAATKPISFPRGLALDSAGNLYVANSNANDILVYNCNYVQMTAKTITQGVVNPSAVAFDRYGNLWVANNGPSNGSPNGSVAEYIGGVQNTSATVTAAIAAPQAIAINGLNNLWVEDGLEYVTVYSPWYEFGPPTTLDRLISLTPPVYGLAVAGGNIAWGGPTTALNSAAPLLISGVQQGTSIGETGFAITSDASGNLYLGNLDNTITVVNSQGSRVIVTLDFVPFGLAVDTARGRIYASNYFNGISSYIAVYNMSGTLLHTIQ